MVVTFDQIVGVNVDKVAADTLSRGEGQCQVLVPARWRQVTSGDCQVTYNRELPFINTIWLHVDHSLVNRVWTGVVDYLAEQNTVCNSLV